jgi:hypothetical protein
MHTGDLFPTKGAPFMDTGNGGSGIEFPKTLDKAAKGIKGVETVIPGHSAVMTWNDFKEYTEFIRDMVAAIGQAKKEGKSEDQAATDLKLPEKYKSYNLGRLKADIKTIYTELNVK